MSKPNTRKQKIASRLAWREKVKQQKEERSAAQQQVIRAYNLKTFGVELLWDEDSMGNLVKKKQRKRKGFPLNPTYMVDIIDKYGPQGTNREFDFANLYPVKEII